MIKLKILLQEIVDGDGYLTKQKFASVIKNELQKSFMYPSKAEIDILLVRDMKKGEFGYTPRSKRDKDGHALVASRAKIHNSDLGVVYEMSYKEKIYQINICNVFKKVPDEELTNKFTMADDETLKKIPSKSLEPRDFNIKNKLIIWLCNVKTDGGKILIPKKPGYAILFDNYDTLQDLIADVKRVIDKDAGNDFNDSIPTQPVPVEPRFQTV